MASDETEFDKLLREAREWEARDRARHPPFGMKEHGDADPFPRPSPSPAPTVTIEQLRKKIAIDVKPKIAAPKISPQIGPPKIDAPKAAAAIKGAIQDAMRQAQAQRTTVREKKKGGWGWIWILIVLYILFKTFLR